MKRKSYFHADDEQIKHDSQLTYEEKVESVVSASTTMINLQKHSPYVKENEELNINRDILPVSIGLLGDLNIKYCLIGAFAVNYYGAARTTTDIDFLIFIENKKIEDLLSEIREQGFEAEYRAGGIDDVVGDVIKVRKKQYQADMIIAKHPYYLEVIGNGKKAKYFQYDFNIASPEDLIILKIRAGSIKDLSDAQNIYRSIRGKLDIDYVIKQAKRFKKDKVFEKIAAEG